MVLLKLLGLVVGAAGGLVAYKLHSRKDKKAYVSRCRTAAAQWAGSDDELAAFFLERGQKAGAGTERPIKQLVHDAMFGEVVNEWSLGEATEMQVVCLGGGFNTQPWRMEGLETASEAVPVHWFDVDARQLLDVKLGALSREKAQLRSGASAAKAARYPLKVASYAAVRADPRDGPTWGRRLKAAGFDPARPTIWLAHDLLLYQLPLQEAVALLRTVRELSSPAKQGSGPRRRGRGKAAADDEDGAGEGAPKSCLILSMIDMDTRTKCLPLFAKWGVPIWPTSLEDLTVWGIQQVTPAPGKEPPPPTAPEPSPTAWAELLGWRVTMEPQPLSALVAAVPGLEDVVVEEPEEGEEEGNGKGKCWEAAGPLVSLVKGPAGRERTLVLEAA